MNNTNKNPPSIESGFCLVQVTGLPPVAALADKQPFRLFGPSDKLPAAIFSLSSPSIYQKKKQPELKLRLLFLVQVTGLEPTRIASLEPESSASAKSATPAYKIEN